MGYLRLKNATIGYNFSSSMLKKLKIDQARISLTGVNLFTFSKFKMFDPEIGNGISSGNGTGQGDVYPPSRVISLGLNLTF